MNRAKSESAVCSGSTQRFPSVRERGFGREPLARCHSSPDVKNIWKRSINISPPPHPTPPPLPFGSRDPPGWEEISHAALAGVSRTGACRQTLVSCVGVGREEGELGWVGGGAGWLHLPTMKNPGAKHTRVKKKSHFAAKWGIKSGVKR